MRESRRQFMRKTGFAIGIFGTSSALGQHHAADDDLDPSNYPWSVHVDKPAQATLYLLRGRSLRGVLNCALYDTLEQMRSNAASANGPQLVQLLDAINARTKPNPAYTQENLVDQLTATRNACEKSLSYIRYASIDYEDDTAQFWDEWNALEPELEKLAKMICVPILQTNPRDVNRFRIARGALDDIDHHGEADSGREIRHLFIYRRSRIDNPPRSGGRHELNLWREARDIGLLWCAPRIGDQYAGAADNKPLKDTPNKKKCVNGVCVDGEDNDYCQMVDGRCNGMATP